MRIRTYIFVVAVFFTTISCFTENTTDQAVTKRYPDLVSMNSSINNLKSLIDSKTKDLGTERDENEKNKIKSDITKLNQRLNTAKITFANTVGDVNLFLEDEEDSSKQKDRDAVKELQDLMLPFIDSLKNATKKPRKIEQLRYNIEKMDNRIAMAEKAVQNINTIESSTQLAPLKDNIEISKRMIQKYISESSIQRNIFQNDLDKELKGKSSFFAITDMIKEFFSTKGKNLLISLGIAFLLVFILSWLRKRIFNLKFFLHDSKNLKKTFNALYGAITGMVSVLAGVTALYLLNDWFLFSFSILILIAVFWSLKKYLPKFLAEIKLILNLGPVKEGQRIVWNNCPWIVKKLGMTVQIENEYLDTPPMILPVREMLNLYSRPLTDDEQLFPSRKGDFVMLSNNNYGEIKNQTPENVVISLSSTLQVTYTILEYFLLKPQNYSNGFQLNIILSLDYKHQKNIFDLENIIKKELSTQIRNNTRFASKYFRNLIVEYKEPSATSLDLLIWLDCAGELAPEYNSVKRFINSVLLKISYDNDLIMRPKA